MTGANAARQAARAASPLRSAHGGPVPALVVAALALVVTPHRSWAQQAPPRATATAASQDKDKDKQDVHESQESLAEAERHFRRGVELYDDGDLAAAFVEFSRAYQLVPNYKILYNLGQVAYRRQDYVHALEHFRRYLADGRDGITPQRRRQVEQDLRRLEQRIGHLAVELSDDDAGATVLIDDVPLATAPLHDEVAASVGPRKVELLRTGGERQSRLVNVVGGETTRVHFPRTVRLAPTPLAMARAADSAPRPRGPALLTRAPSTGGSPDEAVDSSARSRLWIGWTATGLLVAGAAVTGALAFTTSRDLQQRRDSYPLRPGELDAPAHRARLLALSTDGLLVGAVAAAAVSLYLTLTNPPLERTVALHP